MCKQKAYILIELVILLAIVGSFLPAIYKFIYAEINQYQKLQYQTELNTQIQYTGNYLQSLVNQANTVSVFNNTLFINTASKSYEIGLKKNALYVKQEAYRYLTTAPVVINSIIINNLNEKLIEIKTDVQNKTILLRLS